MRSRGVFSFYVQSYLLFPSCIVSYDFRKVTFESLQYALRGRDICRASLECFSLTEVS